VVAWRRYVVERSVKAMFGNPASWQPIAGAVSQGVAMFKKLLAAGEDGAAPIVASQVPPQAFDDYAYIASRLADVIPAVLPHVKTLVHNDVRLDNMVLGDGELVMLDWQAYVAPNPTPFRSGSARCSRLRGFVRA